METTATLNRIHPMMATAAISLTLVSLVGAAAIAGLLPNSHGAAVTNTRPETSSGTVVQGQQLTSAPIVREVIRYKTVVHHDYRPRLQAAYAGDRNQLAQSDQTSNYRPAPVYQQSAQVAQNSPLGIGLGAIVGGLAGSRVGGGNGRTLAAIAGAIGGGYVGNEIAKRNQSGGQQ